MGRDRVDCTTIVEDTARDCHWGGMVGERGKRHWPSLGRLCWACCWLERALAPLPLLCPVVVVLEVVVLHQLLQSQYPPHSRMAVVVAPLRGNASPKYCLDRTLRPARHDELLQQKSDDGERPSISRGEEWEWR